MRYKFLQVGMGKIRLQENWGFCLNNKNCTLGKRKLSTGTQGSCGAIVSPLPLLDLLIMYHEYNVHKCMWHFRDKQHLQCSDM